MEKTLQILVAGISWPPETFITLLLRGLLDHGLQITVACAPRPSGQWLNRPGFHWLPAPVWEGSAVMRMARLGVAMLRARLVASRDYDIFSTFVKPTLSRFERLRSWNRWLPFAGRRWDVVYFPWNSAAVNHLPLFDLGMPVVISCRGSQINIAPHNHQRREFTSILSAVFQKAAAVHCVSNAIQQEALQFGLDPQKALVIHPAVDTIFFQPRSDQKTNREILHVVTNGTFSWVKGFEYALLAVRQLVDQGVPVEFTLIGDGPERQRILYTIDDLGLLGHVKLTGTILPEQVREGLQHSDVFLLSSLSEGISNAALEAMACGLPVVSTDAGGMREAVMDGVEGYVTPLCDPAGMASALMQLWQDPGLRLQMGSASRARVLKEFELERQMDQWMVLFKGLMQVI